MDAKSWFRKALGRGVTSEDRKVVPDGVWVKCGGCKEILYREDYEKNLSVCAQCNHHGGIDANAYLDVLTDDGFIEEISADLVSGDALRFVDSKKYPDRIEEARKKSGMNDAVIAGLARIDGLECAIAIMDFRFIGGSMGSVVGEKIARAMRIGLDKRIPVVTVARSGGARMQEGILSLMQLVKTSAVVARLGENQVPYVSILTNPTMAGVMASYASLGDVIMSEPGALLGFAGPRVIRDTIKEELPEGFQSAEFFLEHGMIDMIVDRKDMRSQVGRVLRHLGSLPATETE